MPYLAKMPFSLATNSGAASVSAMKPSLAPCHLRARRLARMTPNGKLRLHGAEQRGGAGAGLQECAAADAVGALSASRGGHRGLSSFRVGWSSLTPGAFALSQQKSRSPKSALARLPRSAALLVGPSLDLHAALERRRRLGQLYFKLRASPSETRHYRRDINGLREIARLLANRFDGGTAAAHLACSCAKLLCSAKNEAARRFRRRHAPDAPGREMAGDVVGIERRSGEGADAVAGSPVAGSTGAARPPRRRGRAGTPPSRPAAARPTAAPGPSAPSAHRARRPAPGRAAPAPSRPTSR